MYKIFADDTLIYDSTLEDYKIGKGQITHETGKSGSFVFSVYPDHPFYDSFVRLKTIITVYKGAKIVFRGRILNDVTDYWNNKVITCEGELGFLNDSVIRPFSFTGTPEDLFKKFIQEHNSQVDDFKKFKVGTVTVVDPNNYINRSNTDYEPTIDNLNSRLIEDTLGGYFFITHGEDGTEEIPTLNYLADFTHVSSQTVEFGSNLKDYTKTVNAEDIATAIIPLGQNNNDVRVNIKSVNNNVDYVYDANAVALYGWIFKVVTWDDVTVPSILKTKAEEYLESVINQSITIELNAIDLHLLDHDIESFALGDYIKVKSDPHGFNSMMLCNKQTIDLLKPENDSLVLGSTYSVFTERNAKLLASMDKISSVQTVVKNVSDKVINLNETVITVETKTNDLETRSPVTGVSGDITIASGSVSETDITFDTPFEVAPVIVLGDILATATGVKASIVISTITESGFHVTITNNGSAEITVKVMYVAYPTLTEEVSSVDDV